MSGYRTNLHRGDGCSRITLPIGAHPRILVYCLLYWGTNSVATIHSDIEILPNNGVQGTLHKVSGPLTRDVGHTNEYYG